MGNASSGQSHERRGGGQASRAALPRRPRGRRRRPQRRQPCTRRRRSRPPAQSPGRPLVLNATTLQGHPEDRVARRRQRLAGDAPRDTTLRGDHCAELRGGRSGRLRDALATGRDPTRVAGRSVGVAAGQSPSAHLESSVTSARRTWARERRLRPRGTAWARPPWDGAGRLGDGAGRLGHGLRRFGGCSTSGRVLGRFDSILVGSAAVDPGSILGALASAALLAWSTAPTIWALKAWRAASKTWPNGANSGVARCAPAGDS